MKELQKFLVAVVALLCTTAHGDSLTLDQYRAAMERLVKHLPEESSVSIQAEVLGSQQVLFSHGAGDSLVPASNAKLLSTLTALAKLDPSFKMMSHVYALGANKNGVIHGDLVIRGEGDPFLVSERLWLLARSVARSGIKKVTGGIKINDSYFSEEYRGLVGWGDSGEPFAALVSASSLNFNSLEVHIIPDGTGKRPRIELGPVPHNYAKIRNELRYVGGKGRAVGVRPLGIKNGYEEFAIVGSVGREAGAFIAYGSVANPAHYVAAVFAAMLRAEGVLVAKDFTGSVEGALPSEVIATQESPPLLDLARSLNTYSNNFMAEQVFQVLGAVVSGKPANIERSREVVREYLEAFPDCKKTYIDNGSGLSWDAKANAKCFVTLLQNTYRDFRVFADLLGSMPVGGKTGTLKDRFKRNGPDFDAQKMRAKTGTLFSRKAVTSLVGFTPTRSGTPVVFAIIQNDKRADSSLVSAMRDWEDRCVELLQQLQL